MIGKTEQEVLAELQKAGTAPDAIKKIAPHKVPLKQRQVANQQIYSLRSTIICSVTYKVDS